jgi:hypothetical protein
MGLEVLIARKQSCILRCWFRYLIPEINAKLESSLAFCAAGENVGQAFRRRFALLASVKSRFTNVKTV